MNEKEIMKGNLKISCFDSFPYSELKPILEFIEKQGYEIDFVDNGNIVCQKIICQDALNSNAEMELDDLNGHSARQSQQSFEKPSNFVQHPDTNEEKIKSEPTVAELHKRELYKGIRDVEEIK